MQKTRIEKPEYSLFATFMKTPKFSNKNVHTIVFGVRFQLSIKYFNIKFRATHQI